MNVLIGFLVTAVAVVAAKGDEQFHPLENPELFEGDILGYDPDDRNVIPYPQRRWPNATIPYAIHPSLKDQTKLIEKAMEDYHTFTCVRFVKRTDEKHYIKFFEGKGCYSYVGMIHRGAQPISLGPGCWYKGTIVHEIGHAVGFFHEQNRSDRDEYLTIHWKNIRDGMENQFTLLKPRENDLITPFDHNSIMLYGNFAFAKNRKEMTMEAKNGKPLLEPNVKNGLTLSDIKRVRKMYNCEPLKP